MDWEIDNKILNSNAVQNPFTPKPSINLSASRIMQALITNKNKPRVTMVIGIVKMIKIGFKIALSNAKTTATIIAASNPLTATPGKKCAKSNTIPAVIKSLRMSFMMK